MTESHQDSSKEAKKLAKAAAKTAKKEAKAEEAARAAEMAAANPPDASHDGESPAERSARAAERKVRLEQWRTMFAAVTAIVGLLTILFAVQRGCGLTGPARGCLS